MLDEVIEYLKQLQAQVQMMSRMSMPPMMLPMAMQQQLQMSMMAPMGMGMGMGMGLGMGMDMNNINRSNISGISPVLHPTAFMPMTSWDAGSGDRIQANSPAVMADPFSTFLACQSQVNTCWILCWQFSHSLAFSALSSFIDFGKILLLFAFSLAFLKVIERNPGILCWTTTTESFVVYWFQSGRVKSYLILP